MFSFQSIKYYVCKPAYYSSANNRSRFIKLFIATFFLLFSLVLKAGDTAGKSVDSNNDTEAVPYYGKFKEILITSIQPEGWIKTWLKNQKEGLTGYLGETGAPFDKDYWAEKETEGTISWWPYEQTAYWIDGIIRCGILLNDQFLIQKAEKYINFVLNNPDSTGYLGPDLIREDRWALAVFLRAVMADYDLNNHETTIERIIKHYLGHDYPYKKHREQINIENIMWAYSLSKENQLIELATKLYGTFDSITEDFTNGKPSDMHGVTYNEFAKLGAIMYLYTGNKEYLSHSISAYHKVDKYHKLVDGLHISTERLMEYNEENLIEGHETCNITDYIWSAGYVLMATGDASYADNIEKVCMNALPGSVLPDFKGLQYFSAPNQVIAADNTNHCKYHKGISQMEYAPQPWPRVDCCPGNVNRAMPSYVCRLWMKDDNNGIVAAVYGPSAVTFKTVKNELVNIKEETQYPFSDKIDFTINTEGTVKFPFTYRIPGWCKSPQVLINGKKVEVNEKGYQTINREFRDGDKITLILPSEIHLVKSPKKGLTVEKGPLVFALKIKDRREISKVNESQSKRLPAYNMYPVSKWNYALEVKNNALVNAEIIRNDITGYPWSMESSPIVIRTTANELAGWELERKKEVRYYKAGKEGYIELEKEGDFIFTPTLPDPLEIPKMISKKTETIDLVPLGYTQLRITIFPFYDSSL